MVFSSARLLRYEISNFLIFLLGVLLPFDYISLAAAASIYFDVQQPRHFFSTVRRIDARLNGKNRRSAAAADGQGESHQSGRKTKLKPTSSQLLPAAHTVI
jgi:hypothetical protein